MKRFGILILLISFFSSFSYAVQFSSAKSELCYTKRVIPQKYDLVFDAMKSYLISSKFLLKSGDKSSKFLYTEGMIVIDNEHYEIKLSVNFKTKFVNEEEVTSISVVANYKMIEESNKMETLTLGAISFSIPTPWNKEFRLKKSDNIKDPAFFKSFYYGFYKVLYQEEIDNFGTQKDIKKVEEKIKKEESPKKEIKKEEKIEVEEGIF
jgi:hypothetical protein